MCVFDKKWGNRRIDPCMRRLVKVLKREGYNILDCCCGHGKYPTSIVYNFLNCKKPARELISDKVILRKAKFYRRDAQGVYYIPEVCSPIDDREVGYLNK